MSIEQLLPNQKEALPQPLVLNSSTLAAVSRDKKLHPSAPSPCGAQDAWIAKCNEHHTQ
jgi:hypothetical protein